MSKNQEAIGIDIGGTKIELGRVDKNGQILSHLRLKTDVNGPQAVEKQVVEAVHELLKSSENPPVGIGIGFPGQIDAKTGMVYFAPNLSWHNVPFQENLKKALHLPIKITNDVRAITWGEWIYGAGKGSNDLICLFVGTGIGSGIVSGGRLLSGHTNAFGEVGHMTIDLHGPLCTCGNIGCLEAFAGGYAITKWAREAAAADPVRGACLLESAGGKIASITTETVVKAFRQHDPLAIMIVDRVKNALVAGCTSLVNAFNPQRLILGGGVIDGLPELIPLIDAGIRTFALKSCTRSLEVVPALLGKQVGVIGAAAMMFNRKD